MHSAPPCALLQPRARALKRLFMAKCVLNIKYVQLNIQQLTHSHCSKPGLQYDTGASVGVGAKSVRVMLE